jgi:hypothetical protein
LRGIVACMCEWPHCQESEQAGDILCAAHREAADDARAGIRRLLRSDAAGRAWAERTAEAPRPVASSEPESKPLAAPRGALDERYDLS